MSIPVPVILFVYARPDHLARVLFCLRENAVPLILAYADGAKGPEDAERVGKARALLRSVDWCEVRLTERTENMGLGANVLAGVSEVAAKHDAFIVWEDDLICVPGTYAWMCAALREYRDDKRVMSVSAWTHPRVIPADVGDRPYFDGRADCWVWGAWARSWWGMTKEDALSKMHAAEVRGLPRDAYGSDLPAQAAYEGRRNVWAVRWLYHHFLHGGLCVRPPWSMVEHIGFDVLATNAGSSVEWANPSLREAPAIPAVWPEPMEQPACRDLWSKAFRRISLFARIRWRLRRIASRALKIIPIECLRERIRCRFGWRWFRGDYRNWADAREASGGYDDGAIVRKVLQATLAVKAGRAAFERDSVLFADPMPDKPLLTALDEVRRTTPAGRLRVLDFGGSLGTNYWRHRLWLPSGQMIRWDVVEQSGFVAAGREHLMGTPMHFYEDIDSAAHEGGPYDVLLCSGVLQYLEDPWARLGEWMEGPAPYLLLNNLPLRTRGRTRLRVQCVPPEIYTASYPVWFFNRTEFLRLVLKRCDVVREFASEANWCVDWGRFQSTGLLLKRRGTP